MTFKFRYQWQYSIAVRKNFKGKMIGQDNIIILGFSFFPHPLKEESTGWG
jgi:hypothetical protein